MSAGFRSPAALWVGGAAAVPAAAAGGYRSLLAFWMGGACAPVALEPPVIFGGGRWTDRPIRIPVDPLRAKQLAEDELIAVVIAAALPLLH